MLISGHINQIETQQHIMHTCVLTIIPPQFRRSSSRYRKIIPVIIKSGKLAFGHMVTVEDRHVDFF